MLGCCKCFVKGSKNQSKVSVERTNSEHYTLGIENASCTISVQSSKPQTDSQLDILTDSSSLPLPPTQSRLQNEIPLYLPSKSPILPVPSQVSDNFQIFESILDLESDPDWDLKLEKPFAYIMVRTGTKTHPEIPLMKAFFDLELNIDPDLVYDILYNPDIRKKWDLSLGEYIEFNKQEGVIQYYMLNKAPWPFADRDFVETRYIRKRVNGDLEVCFSATLHEDFPEIKEKAVRAEVVIGGQIFRKRISPNTGQMSLIISTIVQADLKGEIPKKMLKITLPASVFKWFKSVKKQVEACLNDLKGVNNV